MFYKDQAFEIAQCTALRNQVHSVWFDLYEDHPIEHHNDTAYNKWIDHSKFEDHTEIKVLIDRFCNALALKASGLIGEPAEWICKGITRWDPGTSMNPHIDAEPGWEDRELAAMIYLNSDFTGGELYFSSDEFPYGEKSFQPNSGMCVIFPCKGEMFRHGVTTIETGVRYTLSGWLKKRST
jgi:Rps23 Pro-64 3,4-dihydroxylase Tpa1-like proline 4-hydroxylase